MTISNFIDELVREIKSDSAVEDIIFVRGYNSYEAPNPVSAYIAAVSVESTSIGTRFLSDRVGENEKGMVYDIALKIRVYAPNQTDGTSLLNRSLSIKRAMENRGADYPVSNIRLSGIQYDTQVKTVYRDIDAVLNVCFGEEII